MISSRSLALSTACIMLGGCLSQASAEPKMISYDLEKVKLETADHE